MRLRTVVLAAVVAVVAITIWHGIRTVEPQPTTAHINGGNR